MTTNMFVRFQNLLGKEPVTRVEVITANADDTVTCTTSSGSSIRIENNNNYIAGDFVYLKGDVITGKAPSLTITEVIV